MKPLIRRTLFMLARLGLFLAVVAWGVGQRRNQPVVSFPSPCGQIVLADYSLGVVVARPGASQIWQWTEPPLPGWNNQWQGLWFRVDNEFWMAKSSHQSIAGIVSHRWGITRVISIRHWLIVTVFALFYSVLKWIYRKPDSPAAHTSAVDD